MSRISRIWHGPDFRGHKPIQICIVNYRSAHFLSYFSSQSAMVESFAFNRDKEEILRKARLLKGSNIYISEDFSRKVREHRHELIKFMKVRPREQYHYNDVGLFVLLFNEFKNQCTLIFSTPTPNEVSTRCTCMELLNFKACKLAQLERFISLERL